MRDLEFYSRKPISDEDPDLKRALLSDRLDTGYTPQFSDVALYAQVLFLHHDYRAAARILEKGLTMVPPDGAPFKSATFARRVMRDQAGMSYGISGDFAKARSIFEGGKLACAGAGENKLSDARIHLKKAFDRKANLNPGETMPVPAEDDSFLPYKRDGDFWVFQEHLQTGR